MTIGRRKN